MTLKGGRNVAARMLGFFVGLGWIMPPLSDSWIIVIIGYI